MVHFLNFLVYYMLLFKEYYEGNILDIMGFIIYVIHIYNIIYICCLAIFSAIYDMYR